MKEAKPIGRKKIILPSNISKKIKIIPIIIQISIIKNQYDKDIINDIIFNYLPFFWNVCINVSKLPNTPVISVGNINVFDEDELATSDRASTCLFMISKFTAGWPFLAIASANNLVCSASALALTVIE